ncbi:MAG: MSMEG_0565 family glycosyltransferase [Cyanobacteria bacterium J06621_3]
MGLTTGSSTKLRIALLTYSTKPRGSVVHTLELANALHELGHAPCVFALDKDQKGFHRVVNFQTYSVPSAPCEGDIDQLIKQRIGEFVTFFQVHLETHTYDIYHAQDCLSANALASLKAQGRISQFVRTVHHVEAFRSPYLQDCQEKSIYQPDQCLCVSELWQQVLKTDYGLTAYRVSNGVSDRFSPQHDGSETALAKRYGIQDGLVYLTVGGIEPRKNSINLLKAFALVRQQQPQVQLVIAGGATLFDYQDYRQQFMAVADNLDIKDALILPGVVPDKDMPPLYRLADGFVFPSVKEGWGLVLLEAIASGIPVLTSNRPPFTEFLSSKSAILVDPTDVRSIAQGMERLPNASVPDPSALLGWQLSAQQHFSLYLQLV